MAYSKFYGNVGSLGQDNDSRWTDDKHSMTTVQVMTSGG